MSKDFIWKGIPLWESQAGNISQTFCPKWSNRCEFSLLYKTRLQNNQTRAYNDSSNILVFNVMILTHVYFACLNNYIDASSINNESKYTQCAKLLCNPFIQLSVQSLNVNIQDFKDKHTTQILGCTWVLYPEIIFEMLRRNSNEGVIVNRYLKQSAKHRRSP